MGFPGGSAVRIRLSKKEMGVRSLGREDPLEKRGKWQPTPVSLPGKFRGQRSLAGYSPWGSRVGQLNMRTCVQFPTVRVCGSSILPLMDAWVPIGPGSSVGIITWPSLPSFQLRWLALARGVLLRGLRPDTRLGQDADLVLFVFKALTPPLQPHSERVWI